MNTVFNRFASKFSYAIGILILCLAFPMGGNASHHHETKYIQGGAPNGGDGSKENPYNSFAQAEAASWDVLVVLPSPTIIYGGIALKDGQKIKGEDRNACLFASQNASVHNGDVIVANGDNVISGITITTAFRCGIEALNARNLYVKNCGINNTNPTGIRFPIDYVSTSSTNRLTVPWFAISFFGGPTVTTGIQPYNTQNGKFKIDNCSLVGNTEGIIVGSGDSMSTTFVTQTYRRKYDISNCQFTNSKNHSIIPYPSGGGYLSGSITNCLFLNGVGSAPAIEIASISNNTNFPGRGNYQLGKYEVSGCTFKNLFLFGVYSDLNGNLTNDDAKIIIKNNNFHDVGLFGNNPPAGIEKAAASIQLELTTVASGNPFEWIIHENVITDTTGLLPAISTFFLGGDQKVFADIQRNTVVGTTTVCDIFFYNNPGTANQANGDFYIANNKFKDNDNVLVVAVGNNSPFTDLNVKVENNCFENTGARNSPPVQQPPFDNGSYYGAAVIFGGADNTALSFIQATGTNLGNAIVDLGGGPLHSRGHNSFINTTGADTWVEPGLNLYARKNWFGGDYPVDAGVGGNVYFDPVLCKGPCSCKVDEFLIAQ